MIKIAGMWEQGWNAPLIEANYWEMLLRDFGVEHLCMAPVSGLAPRSKIKLFEKDTMEEILEANSELIKVWVDERGETELSEFEHPESAIYIFCSVGPNIFHLKKPEDKSLYIKTVSPREQATMFAIEACGIVLYDRFCKEK